jgi:tetratricopeptide (TPR) repeat protein
MDSTFYEAYIGIGTYDYWMSRNTEFLNGLPFYNDNTQIGIDKLREAIDKSSYTSYLATHSLVWIYIDQHNYSEAIKLAQKAVNDFPTSRYFKWGLARAYEDIDPATSIEIYNEILLSFLDVKSNNHINEITLKHLIAQQYFKIGDIERSLSLCENILSMTNLSDYEISRLENRLERVKELRFILAGKKG